LSSILAAGGDRGLTDGSSGEGDSGSELEGWRRQIHHDHQPCRRRSTGRHPRRDHRQTAAEYHARSISHPREGLKALAAASVTGQCLWQNSFPERKTRSEERARHQSLGFDCLKRPRLRRRFERL
jgi:hypothetical protein